MMFFYSQITENRFNRSVFMFTDAFFCFTEEKGGGDGGENKVTLAAIMAVFAMIALILQYKSVGDFGSVPDRAFFRACEIFCACSYWVSFSLMSKRLSSILRISSRACWSRN